MQNQPNASQQAWLPSQPTSRTTPFAHSGYKEMIQWYKTVFCAKIQHENEFDPDELARLFHQGVRDETLARVGLPEE
jgi:hypothetical protein